MFRSQPISYARRGFTLVEIILVILLLGIAVAAVLIGTRGGDAVNARVAADYIATDIEYARDEAIRRQATIIVTFSPSTETYTIADGSNNPISHPLKKTAYTININDEIPDATIDMVSADFGGSMKFAYSDTGEPMEPDLVTPISDTNKVVVKVGDDSYSLHIRPLTGRVAVSAD